MSKSPFVVALLAGSLSLAAAFNQARAGLLGLEKVPPDIFSPFVLVDYDADTDLFKAVGGAAELLLANATHDIYDGVFLLEVNIDGSGKPTGGPGLEIRGRIPTLGINSVTTLVAGEIDRFGFTDPPVAGGGLFEFTFDLTGGALASHYVGSLAQIIVDPGTDSTFNGTFTNDFTNESPWSPIGGVRFASGTADTFAAPEPSSVVIWLAALSGIGATRIVRRRRKLPS